MPKASPAQTSFVGGEISPLAQGQVTSERYKIGLDLCENYVPLVQGALTRRPGNYFVAEVKDSTKAVRLVRFVFSTTQAYILEFGHLYVRIYRNHGQIVEDPVTIATISAATPPTVTYTGSDPSGFNNGDEVYISGVAGMTQVNGRNFKVLAHDLAANTFTLGNMDSTSFAAAGFTAGTGGTFGRVVTIVTPYTEAQLFEIDMVQSADVLYLVHPSHAPAKLSRTADVTWTLADVAFLDGPYEPESTSGFTMTMGHSTNTTTTLTSSAVTFFTAADVGRSVRVLVSGIWAWLKITVYNSATEVTITRSGPTATFPLGVSAIKRWRYSLWNAGAPLYPSSICFHEGRLWFGTNPQRLDGSCSGDYENFAPSSPQFTVDGVSAISEAVTGSVTSDLVTDDKAVSRTLDSEEVSEIFWMRTEEKALIIGTPPTEWAVRPSVLSEPISPSNISAKAFSGYGSARIAPVISGKSIMFVQATEKTVRELTYDYTVDGYRSQDRTVLADHISGASGFKQIARQKDKPSVNWFVRNDGVLAGMTYEKEDDALLLAWHRHALGGSSDAAGSSALAESVAVIPNASERRDEAWFVVKRWINGRVVKCIEYQTAIFDHTTEQKDAYFVDCGLKYDNPLTLSAVTKANPAVATVTSHGLINGDRVLFSNVLGMTQLNGNSYRVRNKTTHTFELESADSTPTDSTAYDTYVSGGAVRKYVSTITGLWHLEGETVDLLADGATQPTRTVLNGAITLQDAATTVSVGLPYTSRARLLRIEAGAADGTAIGKTKRINRCTFRLYRTLGLAFGTSFENLKPITFRQISTVAGRPPALFSGDYSDTIEGSNEMDGQICFEQDRPLPGTILAIAPQLTTEDRG